MKLHQAFNIALPLEQKITEGVGWGEGETSGSSSSPLKFAPGRPEKSIKKETPSNSEAPVFYFPIDQNHKKIIMVKMDLRNAHAAEIFRSQDPQNATSGSGVLGNWLESCNILLGQMLTKVEQELFDESELNLFSPLKAVAINFKLSEFEFFGARTWKHFDITIPTSFFLWEWQKEKYHQSLRSRSVYDLDNR
ncbi:MAG: hypothetical protein QE271_00655 [Bacteriovoracaceae bacterium]|nr:hypothetical protein [Bacteriovoracaceae bacterium]